MEIHVEIFGRRAVIVRLATRALKALRASLISLRPRYARMTTLTARIAIRFSGNYRRPRSSSRSPRFSQVCQPLEQLFSALQLKAIRHET